jgi:hypothetical protein
LKCFRRGAMRNQSRGAQIPGTGSAGRLNFYSAAYYLWVLSMELASYHSSGIYSFWVAPRLFFQMCRPLPQRKNFRQLEKDGLIASRTQLVDTKFELSRKPKVSTLQQRRILQKR